MTKPLKSKRLIATEYPAFAQFVAITLHHDKVRSHVAISVENHLENSEW